MEQLESELPPILIVAMPIWDFREKIETLEQRSEIEVIEIMIVYWVCDECGVRVVLGIIVFLRVPM